jgi:hypothetical protein
MLLAATGCGWDGASIDGRPIAPTTPADESSAPPIATEPTTNPASSGASRAPPAVGAEATGELGGPSAVRPDGGSAGTSDRRRIRALPLDFHDGPLLLTASFDGSQRFATWIDTLRVARELGQRGGRPVHFTYFVNACYYDTRITGSLIGRAASREEVLVRRALTQLAINEGHEIGNHGVRHEDGTSWPLGRWQRELDEFHAIIEAALFEPVRDETGRAVFPRFEPLAAAGPGETGARCERDADCRGGACLGLGPETGICSQPCNRARSCPPAMACGAPAFVRDADVCVPLPRYPLSHQGSVLFDPSGEPNRSHPALQPYRVVGYRAPFLADNAGLVEALLARKYRYDASQVAVPGPPLWLGLEGVRRGLLGFALMPQPGARAIPMDFNYLRAGLGGEQMSDDYRRSLVLAYAHGRRYPWNVGHHFSQWRAGAYWQALQQTLRFALDGCLDDAGTARCPDVELLSFRELATRVTQLSRAQRRRRPR